MLNAHARIVGVTVQLPADQGNDQFKSVVGLLAKDFPVACATFTGLLIPVAESGDMLHSAYNL